ncbi:hypothetical protein [Gracilibacillus halophilus]|uniref:hypothetical protein n=1 Tax=Gracilibacillus halophilus TaxID=470864 RepID=UPI0003A0AA88|nr:hypothetical protein [Gracilibacillus halophilus]
MRKKLLAILGVSTLTIGMLTACGGDEGEDAPADENVEQEEGSGGQEESEE